MKVSAGRARRELNELRVLATVLAHRPRAYRATCDWPGPAVADPGTSRTARAADDRRSTSRSEASFPVVTGVSSCHRRPSAGRRTSFPSCRHVGRLVGPVEGSASPVISAACFALGASTALAPGAPIGMQSSSKGWRPDRGCRMRTARRQPAGHRRGRGGVVVARVAGPRVATAADLAGQRRPRAAAPRAPGASTRPPAPEPGPGPHPSPTL